VTDVSDQPSAVLDEGRGGQTAPDSKSFFIVGVGASAGGLESLQRLFEGMRPGCGLAFVVVQHLSPDFESVMDELLARHTELEVVRAENEMEVRPDAIFLMPPRTEMIIAEGKLLLTERDLEQGLSLPIDVFLRSLAEDVGARAVGVILSGSGSDGSRGIRAIHEAGGLVVTQSEETAKFDGMPRSAVDTGIVDLILSPEEIREALLRYAQHPIAGPDALADARGLTVASDALAPIFDLLRRESGIDFSHYKAGTVARRIERRLLLTRVNDLEEYAAQLRDNPAELVSLYKDLLIGVTGFFRDRDVFARLGEQVMPELVQRLGPEEELRIWCAACATGEEAYSLAMLAHEAFRKAGRPVRLKVFATDVHRASLEFAGAGVYPLESLAGLPDDLRERYFVPQHDERAQVTATLRGSIVFAYHNVLRDAPFTRLDLITCRNLLIYFKPVAQRKAVSLFLFGLKAGGVMVLGPSETPGSLGDEFVSIDQRWKVYRKRRELRMPPDMRLLGVDGGRGSGAGARAQDRRQPQERTIARAQQALLERYAPPSLLVTSTGDLVHAFNGGGRFLTHHDGMPSLNVVDLLEGELKFAAAAAMKRAMKSAEVAVFERVPARTVEGPCTVRLTVAPLANPDEEVRYLISLELVAERRERPEDPHTPVETLAQERVETLEFELRQVKENLQATLEEMETSNEELQATNEELIASNEELQSTNEELQSVNEELYTVNAEYQAKIAELTELTTDMNHLLESTEVQIIFLDQNLRIRRLTPKIAETFNLLPQDIGRKIDSFTHNLRHEGMVEDLESVLGGELRVEREVQDLRGRWYFLRVLPYRPRQSVEGVVLTLVDISTLKETERELRTSEERYRTLVRAVMPVLFTTDAAGRFAGPQREWEAYTGQAWEAERGDGWIAAFHPHDRDRVREHWEEAVGKQELFEADARLWSREHREHRHVQLRAAPRKDEDGLVHEWVGNVVDVHEGKLAEAALRRHEGQLRAILDHAPMAIHVKNPGGRYQVVSRMAAELLGAEPAAILGKTDYDLVSASRADTMREHDRHVLTRRDVLKVEEVMPHGGASRTFLTVKFPLIDLQGEVYAIAGISADITERKDAEERDRQALRRRDHFLAMLSHELRNPLAAVLNATYTLKRMAAEQPRSQSALSVIDRQALHMARLLDDLLDVTRITLGKIEIRAEALDLRAAAEAALQAVRPLVDGKQLDLRTEIGGLPILVRGDLHRLQQVQSNMLTNAAKFTEPGGKIWFSVRREGDEAVIRVRDSGVGLPAEDLDKVFELFYQRENTLDRSSGGIGVGLSLVRAVVELHGGRVFARSEGLGQGCEFVAALPLLQAQAHIAVAPQKPAAGADGISQRAEVDDLGRSIEVDAIRRRLDGDAITRRMKQDGIGREVERDGMARRIEMDGFGWRGEVDGAHRPASVDGARAASSPTAKEGEARRLSIVIVEDSEDGREMLQLLLEQHGHDVTAFSDGGQGADAIVELQPDLALVDIGLPVRNGYEVARHVREACGDAPIYLVALTGYGRQEDQQAALEAGFNEHVVKPIRPDTLERVVQSVARSVMARSAAPAASRLDGASPSA